MEKDEERIYSIYKILHPDDNRVCYVGVTVKSLSDRLSQHIYAANKSRSTIVSKWIWSLLVKGQRPTIHLVETCTKSIWEEREKFWIAYYPNLYNQLEGGAGVILNRSRNGIQRSIDAHKIPVTQIDTSGSVIKAHESISEAALEVGLLNTAIGNAIRKSSLSGGYYWVHSDKLASFTPRVPKCRSNVRTVFQYSNTGGYLQSYKSVKAASSSVNIKNQKGLKDACNSGNIYQGYYWSFKQSNKVDAIKVYRVYSVNPKDNNIVDRFRTCTDAALAIGKSPSVMTSVLRERQLRDGLYWMYVDDYNKLRNYKI